MATLFELQTQVDELKARLLELSSENKRGNLKPYTPEWEALQQQIRGVESQIVGVENQVAAGNYTPDPKSAPASAGDVVGNAAKARDDGAATTTPPATTTQEGRVFQANQVNQNLETGTNAPVKTTTQTQATPAPGPNATGPQTATSAGAAAPRDDNTGPTSNSTQQLINDAFGPYGLIKPQPNVLDQYASYTYSLSWYILSQDQYKSLQAGTAKNPNQWQLLAQSGGITNQTTTGGATGRNKYFNLDYYLDNLVIDSSFNGAGTSSAHNATDMSFTVTEPNGLTLIGNLYKAAQSVAAGVTPTGGGTQGATGESTTSTGDGVYSSFISQPYLMAVRFYGYNDQGNLVQVGRNNSSGNNNGTDPASVVEKFYPFLISDITFKLVGKVVEYAVSCQPVQQFYALSDQYASIPFNFQLSGKTVGELLGSKSATQSNANPADAGRVSTPTPASAPYVVNSVQQPFATSGIPAVGGINIAPTTPVLNTNVLPNTLVPR